MSMKAEGTDMVEGADAIATFIYGRTDARLRRRIYQLHTSGQIPTIRIGGILHMRPSTYRQFVEDKERAALSKARAT